MLPATDPEIIKLRKSMALLNLAMNRLSGIDRGKKSELSPMAISILYLSYFKKIRMNDIARINNITKSTATDYIDNLENKGYISRVRSESDRRDIFIIPTEKGRKWILDNEERIFAYMRECLSRLTDEEQDLFIHIFFKFVGNDDVLPYDALMETLMKRPLSGEQAYDQERFDPTDEEALASPGDGYTPEPYIPELGLKNKIKLSESKMRHNRNADAR